MKKIHIIVTFYVTTKYEKFIKFFVFYLFMKEAELKKINRQSHYVRELANIPLFAPIAPFVIDVFDTLTTSGIAGLENLIDSPTTMPALLFIFLNQRNHNGIFRDNITAMRNERLLTEGDYSANRNPKYTYMRLSNVAFFLAYPTEVGAAAVATYFGASEFLARNEEKYLEGKYGDKYLEYKKRTPRWIPDALAVKLPYITSFLPR